MMSKYIKIEEPAIVRFPTRELRDIWKRLFDSYIFREDVEVEIKEIGFTGLEIPAKIYPVKKEYGEYLFEAFLKEYKVDASIIETTSDKLMEDINNG